LDRIWVTNNKKLKDNCIWNELDEIRIDEKDMEVVFNTKVKSTIPSNLPSTLTKTPTTVITKDKIIDDSQRMKLGIMTKQFKDIKVLKLEIMNMKLISSNSDMMIDLCKKWISSDEENQIVEKDNEEIVNWENIEQFFSDLLKIKKVKQRIQLFKYKLEFDERINDILSPIESINKACDQIIKSKKMKKILR